MARIATKTVFTVGLLILLMSVPALGASINKSVKIAAGEESDGATSVNGSITVGESATVTGNLKTVNGTIRIDDGAIIQKASTVNGGLKLGDRGKAEALSTVNGSIRVGEEATVAGEIEAVNGRITVEKGAHISDNVGNVNGEIDLSGAEIDGNLSTVNGDINLADRSVVKGDIIVEEPGGWNWDKEKSRIPRVVIGPGSRVEGTIVLKRKVNLFISETAEVGGVSGVMSMDDAVRFSGDRP
jgi:cytoskeletal protein CcmA (bactofilin family)